MPALTHSRLQALESLAQHVAHSMQSEWGTTSLNLNTLGSPHNWTNGALPSNSNGGHDAHGFSRTCPSNPRAEANCWAKPLATISAGGMMEDTLGEPKIAKAADQAIHDALASGKIKSLSAGKMGMGTRQVGDMIAKLVS